MKTAAPYDDQTAGAFPDCIVFCNFNTINPMGFLDDLYREHGQSTQERLTTELGIPPEKAAQALPTVAPIILAGLKREMEKGGPAQVEAKIQDLNQNGIPDDQEAGGILGGKGAEVSKLMANQLGISGDAAAKLIPMLAPVIIGMLMKKGGSSGSSSSQTAAGGGLGGMAAILNRNGDGSILDDLTGLFAKGGVGGLLGGGAGQGAGKSGCLGSLLGGLLGGKK